MGEFYLDVEVCAKDGSSSRPVRVKANTGARYTSLPGDLLRGLGWEPEPADRLPIGWPIEMFYDVDVVAGKLLPRSAVHVGEVKLRINEQDYLHSVIFGADYSEPELGKWTVRGFILDADEGSQCLTPIQLIYR